MQLRFGAGEISITGGMHYSSREPKERIVGILLQIGVNEYPAEVIVDTGAPFLICTPQLAIAIGVSDLIPIRADKILFRGQWLDGKIYSLTVAFAPDEEMGDGIALNVRGFVPTNTDTLDDLLPYSRLGWISCLEATPFAVDPGRSTFYYC
jgi:hypothetical protein